VPETSDAIISIHSDYANAILAGTKTIELRRRVPDLAIGTRLWIYATQPTGAIVGYVTIEKIVRAAPRALWNEHRARAGIEYDAFQAYFNGSQEGVAIQMAAAHRVPAITIDQLRGIRDGFHPPQTLTRLAPQEAEALQKLASNHTSGGDQRNLI
jgi:predicted transcriptional regulator